MQELFEHQKAGIEFLKKTRKAILADEMGLGKTRQAVIAANDVGKGVLVVCPASLKINWQREILSVYPEQAVKIHDSGRTPQVARWHIINYDVLEKKQDEILELIRGGVDTLILDESHYIKGKSLRSAVIVGGNAKKKSKAGDTKVKFDGIAKLMQNVFCLTGTPLLNRPIELFNQLKAVGHHLGEKRIYFAKRYCGAYTKMIYRAGYGPMYFMDESGATNLDELRELIKPVMLRRMKKEALDLPPKIVSIMEVELSDEWQKAYNTAWEKYIAFLKENPVPDKNIGNIILARQLVEIQKLKQVCSQAKVDRIVRDVENAVEQDQKVIIFSQYTQTIKILAERLNEHKAVTLTGDDDMQERQKAVDRFQGDPATKVFIANIKAGGVGLNITAAGIVMFADMEWSPEIHSQAEDRAHRIGQGGTVNVYYYVAPGTIEDDIVDILNAKRGSIERVLSDGEDRIGKIESIQEAFLKRVRAKVTQK